MADVAASAVIAPSMTLPRGTMSPDFERFDHIPPPDALVYWQEATYLHFAVPYAAGSELVGGFVYLHRRPLLDGGHVFRASALYWRGGGVWYHASVVPTVFDEDEIFDVPHPFSEMHVRALGWPHRHAQVCSPYLANPSWGQEHTVSLDFVFSASREAFLFEAAEKMGFVHYEQLGRVEGNLWADGREIPLCGVHGARDHTWGTRRWTAFEGYWLVIADLPGGMIHLAYAKTPQAQVVEGIMCLDRTGTIHRVVDVVAQQERPQDIITPAQLIVATDRDEIHTLTIQRPVAFVMPVNPKGSLVGADAEMVAEITWEADGERIQGIGNVQHLQTVTIPPDLGAWPFPVLGDEALKVKV